MVPQAWPGSILLVNEKNRTNIHNSRLIHSRTTMLQDYNSWTQLQKTAGGLPANIFGYLAMLLVKLMALNDLQNPATVLPSLPTSKYLRPDDIPTRSDRPEMHKWPVPQRQSTHHPSPTQFNLLQDRLNAFITRQHDEGCVIRKGTSFDSLDAYFLNKHELFHIHPVDKSFHCKLHPSDAKLLIEKGWAEWFGLAGKVGQGKGTVLLYAMREDVDLTVFERVWEAALRYAQEGKGI